MLGFGFLGQFALGFIADDIPAPIIYSPVSVL